MDYIYGMKEFILRTVLAVPGILFFGWLASEAKTDIGGLIAVLLMLGWFWWAYDQA